MMPPDTALALRRIEHRFGPHTVLEGIDLRVAPGRVTALLGRSGCGKSTLLRIAAGLIAPTRGRVRVDLAHTALVFQQPNLLPWKRLLDNIALGLKARGMGRSARRQRAAELASEVGLDVHDHDKYPAELSGGMQSRAALARALAVQPRLLLLDEPFAALDVGLRADMHVLLARQVLQHGAAALMVTHDVMDALRLAHEVVLMLPDPGRVLARFVIAVPLAERNDAWVYANTGALMAHPAVRQAFELPPVPTAEQARALAQLAVAGIAPVPEGGGA